jgi:hypothetical protein
MLAGVAEIIDSRLGTPKSSQHRLLTLASALRDDNALRQVNTARELSMTYRWIGGREECLRWSWRALDLACSSRMALMRILALLNAMRNAWFWCDPSGSELLEYGDLTVIPAYDAGAFSRWYNWVFHDGDAGFEEPFHEAIAVHLLLMKASKSKCRIRSTALLERAERRVATSDDIALRVIVALAQAHIGVCDARLTVGALVEKLRELPEHDALLAACEAFLRQAPHELLDFCEISPAASKASSLANRRHGCASCASRCSSALAR